MKNNRSLIAKILVFCIMLFVSVLVLNTNKSLASGSWSVSTDINAIDESKYPGFKAKLKELQKTYPNIKLLYTGLDWNEVIKNEQSNSDAHGRNLVSGSLGDEWLCQSCKAAGKTYDSGLYCASKQAVEYMMDPRNFLNTEDIFQFQKLDYTYGTNVADIRAVLNYKGARYLLIDSTAQQAFANVAKNNNLNSFFLITRVIQEQGTNPTSPLATGAGYTGNGYTNYGKGYYNLFSIGATRGSSEPTYMIRVNALTRAMKEGWNSLAKSIEGGGNFVGESYIDVGQNTIYMQKFAVRNYNNQLYWHQYMQNLFAAQNEGLLLKDAYDIVGETKNKDFQFIIPIYKNMPKTACKEPTEKYVGEINTALKTINVTQSAKGDNYISGTIDIAEWIKDSNGVSQCNTPRKTPEIWVKSTDGKVSQKAYVAYQSGIGYYFDRNIENFDVTKTYYIEARLENNANVAASSKKVQKVSIPNKTIGKFKGRSVTVVSSGNNFKLNYKGEINTALVNISLIQNAKGDNYISGTLDIAEWIDGKCKTPLSTPKLTLKSTDGTVSKDMYISYQSGIRYYFDKNIEGLSTSKSYYIEAKLTTGTNIASNKTQKVKISNRTIGTKGNIKVTASGNNIKITDTSYYKGTINTELYKASIIQNAKGRNYISGNINIAEWVNGVCKTPQGLPKMTLKSTDGKYSESMYVSYQSGIGYYFDKDIQDIDASKTYYIEVKLTGSKNQASTKEKTQTARWSKTGTIGTCTNGKRLTLSGNNIKITDTSYYKGTINTELYKMNVIKNSKGQQYITGNIYIAEWVGSSCNTPKGTPKMTLKSTDGKYSESMYVSYQSGIGYYFDRNIEGLDTSKTYYIEVKLTGSKNQASEAAKKQNARCSKQGTVGTLKNGTKLVLSGNYIKFQK